VAEGDAAALATLYDRYSTLAYAVSLKITRDATLAQDIVQEAFLGVWRNAGRYAAGRGSVRTWVLAIAHHRAIDAIRRRRPTSELPEGDAPPLVVPDIWHEVSGRLDREEIRQALETLSPPQREAIELAYYSGLTQQEIAEKTATPLGTVKSRVRLGLLAMRRALEQPMAMTSDGTPTEMGT
jgi:RNA polymerase sigma-70 factor (ECF subfamily)